MEKEILDNCFEQFRRDFDPTKVFLHILLARRTITEGQMDKIVVSTSYNYRLVSWLSYKNIYYYIKISLASFGLSLFLVEGIQADLKHLLI